MLHAPEIRALLLLGTLPFALVRPIHGQLLHPAGTRPSFAVASIRPSSPDEVGPSHMTKADSFTARAMTLKELISYAYGIGYDRELSGGPGWIGTEHFDIKAKPDEAQAGALSKRFADDIDEQTRLMVQSLLIERFHLQARFSTRSLPLYELVIASGGLKCKKIEPSTPLAQMPVPRFRWTALPPPPPPPAGWTSPPPDEARKLTQTMHMRTQYWPFWMVITAIGHEPELNGLKVLDKTGLDGSYDCEVSWSRVGSDGAGPSFFTAIQDQMGLKLVPKKGPVEVLVIDHIEHPSEN
jgi:uncharacterized protein (TIGR03435 family)